MIVDPHVAEALAAGRPVVALESTIISHGLPRPRNLEVARQIEAAVREGGALPATIALVAGGWRGATTWSSAGCAISRRSRPRGAGAARPSRPPLTWRRGPAYICSPRAAS